MNYLINNTVEGYEDLRQFQEVFPTVEEYILQMKELILDKVIGTDENLTFIYNREIMLYELNYYRWKRLGSIYLNQAFWIDKILNKLSLKATFENLLQSEIQFGATTENISYKLNADYEEGTQNTWAENTKDISINRSTNNILKLNQQIQNIINEINNLFLEMRNLFMIEVNEEIGV